MFAKTQENIDRIRTFTPVDEDLAQIPADIARVAIETREQFGLGVDSYRCQLWHDPDGIDMFADIAYAQPTGDTIAHIKAHSLDVYLPHDALLRGGATLPVIVDIHGGGFVYGYKDLNRNFGTHVASYGVAVVSLGYRLAPTTDFMGQLQDIFTALQWLQTHAHEYPIDLRNLFITGDSAGATLALYTAAALNSTVVGEQLHCPIQDLPVRGAIFQSGLFELEPLTRGVSTTDTLPYIAQMGGTFFTSFAEQTTEELQSMEGLVQYAQLPPSVVITSSDDFLETQSLLFAAAMRQRGNYCEIYDVVPAKGKTLGHVFPVGQVWLEESQRVFEIMQRFVFDLSQHYL